MAGSPDVNPDPSASARQEPELLSFVTHEIGNQLTVIGGFAEMLADGVDELPPDLLREFSQAILRGSEQMRTLLQSVSDLRRLDAGRIEVRPETVDVVPIVRKVVDHWGLQLGPRVAEVILPDELVMRVDPARVQQILGNLLSNASKFTPATARLTVELAVTVPHVELSVTDDGPGVPVDQADQVFERFARLGTGGKGAGIGLFVSREVARAHGGDLVLADGEGPGARFVLRLPYPPID